MQKNTTQQTQTKPKSPGRVEAGKRLAALRAEQRAQAMADSGALGGAASSPAGTTTLPPKGTATGPQGRKGGTTQTKTSGSKGGAATGTSAGRASGSQALNVRAPLGISEMAFDNTWIQETLQTACYLEQGAKLYTQAVQMANHGDLGLAQQYMIAGNQFARQAWDVIGKTR
jgi:hypothetical protein